MAPLRLQQETQMHEWILAIAEREYKLQTLPGFQSTRALSKLKWSRIRFSLVFGPFIGLGGVHTWAAVRCPSQSKSGVTSLATQGPRWWENNTKMTLQSAITSVMSCTPACQPHIIPGPARACLLPSCLLASCCTTPPYRVDCPSAKTVEGL